MAKKGIRKVDAVFEGGGVKGIGLVGAVAVTEEQGYEFENVAGTSAGAIVAALVASGYRGPDLKKILNDLDYTKLMDKGTLDRIPGIGPVLSIGFEKGIYEGKYFERWLRDLLKKAPNGPVRSFRDLVMAEYADDPRYRYRLRVVAADISRGKLLVLPQDITEYGRSPDDLDVAWAVRMSMSIPYFYEPVRLQRSDGAASFIVDGGILSNFPVWLFDDGTGDPPWPTFGYKLVEPKAGAARSIKGPFSLFAAMFATMMEAHDALYMKDCDFARTVPIPTLGIRTTDFDLTGQQRNALYRSGADAATDFFKKWRFDKWKASYRRREPPARRERM